MPNFLSHADLTDVGRVRSANEDYHLIPDVPGHHCYIVCDGMGGHAGGSAASRMAASVFAGNLTAGLSNGVSVINAMDAAIREANAAVYNRALENLDLKGMGTTIVALVVDLKGEAFIGYVGDSRIYRYRKGSLNQVTRDDSYVQDLIDRGELLEEDREKHPERSRITKAIGIDGNVVPTVKSLGFWMSGDRFLLCSDGLTGVVSDAELAKEANSPLAQAVEQLIGKALLAGAPDNVTVVMVEGKDNQSGSASSAARGVKRGLKGFLTSTVVYLPNWAWLSSILMTLTIVVVFSVVGGGSEGVMGCRDTGACNHNAAATVDDGACKYLDALGVCGGDCESDANNDGVCDDMQQTIQGPTDSGGLKDDESVQEDNEESSGEDEGQVEGNEDEKEGEKEGAKPTAVSKSASKPTMKDSAPKANSSLTLTEERLSAISLSGFGSGAILWDEREKMKASLASQLKWKSVHVRGKIKSASNGRVFGLTADYGEDGKVACYDDRNNRLCGLDHFPQGNKGLGWVEDFQVGYLGEKKYYGIVRLQFEGSDTLELFQSGYEFARPIKVAPQTEVQHYVYDAGGEALILREETRERRQGFFLNSFNFPERKEEFQLVDGWSADVRLDAWAFVHTDEGQFISGQKEDGGVFVPFWNGGFLTEESSQGKTWLLSADAGNQLKEVDDGLVLVMNESEFNLELNGWKNAGDLKHIAITSSSDQKEELVVVLVFEKRVYSGALLKS